MKFTKMLSVFLALCSFLLIFSGCSSDKPPKETPLDQFVWEDSGDGITITQYTGSAKEVVVPSIINNKKVSSVKSTFNGNVVLESLVLPGDCLANLTDCQALKKLTIVGGSIGYVSIPESLEVLVLDDATCFNLDDDVQGDVLVKELSISSATEIIGGRLKNDATEIIGRCLENDATVTISDSIKYAVIFDESEEFGSIYYCLSAQKDVKNFIRSESASIECIELNEENKAEYYCKVFGCEKVTVNGKTYTYKA